MILPNIETFIGCESSFEEASETKNRGKNNWKCISLP